MQKNRTFQTGQLDCAKQEKLEPCKQPAVAVNCDWGNVLQQSRNSLF